VNCLFTLINPTVGSHIEMPFRIAHVLKDKAVKHALANQKTRDIILHEIERAEKAIGHWLE
jgi:hypothetical protein